MADREAKVKIGADTSKLNAGLNKARGELTKWSRGVKTEVGGALRGAFDGLSTIAGVSGIGAIALAARETKLFNDRLVALQQTTGYSRTAILAMNQALQQTAVATGVQQTDLLAGIEKFQALTGEAKKFSDALFDMATVSIATNAKMEDIAATAAAASQNLGVTGAEFRKMFDILATQGDRGAVELKDMATMMPQLAAAAARFRTQGVAGVAEFGAVMQVVRHGTGTSAEALTQTVDLSSELLVRWRELEKAGVNVFSDKAHKHAVDFLELVDDINKKIPRAELAKVLGSRKEALFAIDAITKYRAELGSLATTEDKLGAIDRKKEVYFQSSTARFNQAMTSLKKTANDLMMGALPGLAAIFERVAKAIDWIAKNKDVVIAALAAWKLAPSLASLAGGGGAGQAGRVAGALAGAGSSVGGAVPVFVTNPGGVGGGAAGALGGAGAAAAKAESGLEKLNRGLDIASKVLFSFAAGYAVGGVIADASGLNDSGVSMDATKYRKYGQFSEDMVRDKVNRIAMDIGPTADYAPIGDRTYRSLIGEKGSARRFNPGQSGIDENMSEEEYVRKSRAGADARSTFNRVNEPINRLVEELRKTNLALANQKMTATLDAVNEKISLAVKRADAKQRRRSP